MNPYYTHLTPVLYHVYQLWYQMRSQPVPASSNGRCWPSFARSTSCALTVFNRELWIVDAVPLLRQVDIPVLVIIGKKDLQVDWQDDGEPLT
jgi:hypothetical protein